MKKITVSIFGFLVAVMVLGISTPFAFAVSGNWNIDAAGNWSAAANWSSSPTVPGTATGDVVGLNFNITAARTVTIDTTARTVGTLNIGDPTSPFFSYTLANSGGANLTLDNSGAGALISQTTVGGAADTNSAPLSLNDNLTVNNVNMLTLSGVISNSPTLSSVAITKTGAGTLTINGANTFVASSVTINGGTLYIPKSAANSGTSGALGNVSGGGMQIYVNSGATLSSGNNNWFGNQTLADSSLPTMDITGGTLAITNNYTTIGILNLTNGATVTSTGTGSGNYYGFQFRGNVYVGGTSPSTISGSRDYHLNVNTVFDVENSGGSPADLVVSANLRNLSGDFGNAAGALTKTGPGKMMITSGGNVFSGSSTISAGTLQIGDGSANNGSLAGYIDDEATLIFANPTAWTYTNYIVGAGNVIKAGAGTLTLSGTSYYTGSTTISNGVLSFTSPQNISGAMTVNDGKTLAVTAAADTTYLAPSSLTLGNSTGANLQIGVFGTTTAVLNPTALTINGTATVNISSCPFVSGVTYPLINNYSSGTLVLGTQPTGITGQLLISGSTVGYQVTNVAIEVWTAGVNTNWDTTTQNWTNSLGGNLYTSGFPIQFDDSAAGAGPLLVNITPAVVAPNYMVVSNTAKSYVIGGLAISNCVSGFTKDGNNTLTLTGTNVFTGPMTILNGQVTIGGTGQLGGGTYAAAITDNGTLSFNSSANQVISGPISGTGAVTNSGPGALILSSGASAFSGGVTLNAGTLTIGSSSTPTSGAVSSGPLGTGALTLASTNGGTLNNNLGNITVANNISVTGSNSVQAVAGANWTLSGNIAGSGIMHQTANGSTAQVGLSGDNSGFTGTWIQDAGNTSLRFDNANAGSASAAWVFNQSQNSQRVRFNFGTGTINFGSISGGSGNVGLANISSGAVVATLNVGALNTSTTFGGGIEANGANGIIALTKVGTGSLTLTAASGYTGLTTVENGSLVAGNNVPSGAAGAFGNSTAAIALGDANSLANNYSPSLMVKGPFTVARPVTVGSATGAFSGTNTIGGLADTNANFSGNISLNQSLTVSQVAGTTNALTISGVIGTLNGTTPSVTFAGPGNIKLTVANTYSGSTVISGGKLILSGSGNIGSSATISVASGATFDVSGVTASPYTLSGSQTLLGSGTITGTVATASSSSAISPATNGVAGTMTFTNNLNLSAGATLYFDLSTSSSVGNDQIVVAGNLTINANDTIHVNALNGSANLDTTADYVLFSVAGTTTMPAQPNLLFGGTAPANANHYSVQKSGNNIVLHYSATAAPTVVSVIATNTLDGSTTAARYQSVTVYATVSSGAGTITNVSVNLSSIGGPALQVMNSLGGNAYSYTTTVGAGATVGSDIITVTATDTQPLSGANSATLTVTPATATWDGLATDNKWGSGNNWVGNNPPGFSGDSIIFTGSTQTTADMDNNYAVAALTFDGSASSFTVTNANDTLTLNGGVTNSSANAQTLDIALTLAGIEDVSDSGAGITLGGAISGVGGLSVDSGTVTLSGSNGYAGGTTVNGTLKVGNGAAIPNGVGKGNVSLTASGKLDLNGTNATINNLLGGVGTVDNSSATLPSILTIGNNNDVISLAGVMVENSGGTNLALVKVGTGALMVSSASTYAGGTTLSNGTLTIGAGGTLTSGPLGTGPLTLAGGTLNNNAANITLPNNINVTASNIVQAVNSASWTLSGNITGNGVLHQTENGAVGQVILSGDNSGFTGTWIQDPNATSLRFDNATAGSANSAWVFNESQNSQRVRFNFGTGMISFGSISGGSGNVGLANISIASPNVATVIVGGLNTSTTFGGGIEANGVNGILALTKVGTGSLTLTAANTYNGLTTVSNGTLVITTAHKGNGDFVVNDGKVLGVINNGGTNTAQLNNLTLGNSAGPTSLFFTNVASNNIPIVTAAGAVTINGTCNIAISNSVVNTGAVYPLVKYGSLAGSGGFALSSVPSGVTATLTNDTSNLWIALAVSVGNNVNTNRTNIIAVVNGSNLVLSWPADHIGWRLQAQTNSLSTGLGTNWVDVPGTSTVNSYTNAINPANGTVFYRMVYP